MAEDDPKPITASLEQHFRDEAALIPAGKRGQLSAAITTRGIGVGGAAKLNQRRRWFGESSVSGWAGREWGGSGWSAGARVGTIF